uniref:Bradykinin-potentiating peptide TmF n=1 Tax=Protobothrops mucrosquamatus TaxID=103944 RepID=BPPF_PROMU|nr:RecName: Full=Bradykinin-potentiating peptide TmF; Short=BPP-TmF [Protobothrops mucrosquamatus]
QGRPLGPPIPP